MPLRKPDDEVGAAKAVDDGRQTDAQRAILGGGGETGGRPEPKSKDEWADRGAVGGEPGRSPVALGGSSGGQGDQMPADGSGKRAANPKTIPGNRHES